MKIVQITIKDLKSSEYNPRYWSQSAQRDLRISIERFGLVDPIIVNSAENRKNIVIGGHFRMATAQKLGYTEVPVHYIDLPDIEKEKELNLRLNKNKGEFDLDLLKEFEKGMLELVGFDHKDLDKIYDDDAEDDFNAKEMVDMIDIPISKIGDIYKLGDHRLMCGSAVNPADAGALMDGDLADMIFTDPPYNVNYSGRGKKTNNKIKGDNQDEAKFRQFLGGGFANYFDFSTAKAALYTCYASRTHREFEDALNKAGYEAKNQIIWVKKVASMGWGDYRWKHEPILYCHKQGQGIEFYGDRSQYTEWREELSDEELLRMVKGMIKKEEKGSSSVWRLHRDQNYDHPTQKPLKLCQIAIRNSSKRHEIVADFFGGSGSTLIACEKMNRKCRMMEIDPKYTDVIIKRWEMFSQGKAEKLTT